MDRLLALPVQLRFRHLADPGLARAIIDLRFGTHSRQEAEGIAATDEPGHLAVFIGQIAKGDGTGRAGLHARGFVGQRIRVVLPLRRSFRPGCLQATVTEIAFLHDAAHAR